MKTLCVLIYIDVFACSCMLGTSIKKCGLRAERERKIESYMAPHVLASGGGELISADACGCKEAKSTTVERSGPGKRSAEKEEKES